MQNYIKKNNKLNKIKCNLSTFMWRVFPTQKQAKLSVILTLVLVFSFVFGHHVKNNLSSVANDEIAISFVSMPVASAKVKKDVISIPDGIIKTNPFLPYKEISGNIANDVPQFDLVEPPDSINESSDAARVMDTIVSGILYDKYSPSAILNIEGNDYLVKKGDVINNYKVLNIYQDKVVVKLGSNTYTAGIGEILTEGEINNNIISNLSHKFGGEK